MAPSKLSGLTVIRKGRPGTNLPPKNFTSAGVSFHRLPVINTRKQVSSRELERIRLFDPATDEGLLEKACQGDEAAFRLLYERHRTAIFRFAYRLLNSVELAEDVTHDCFLSLIKHPRRFDARRASLRTYLYAAARNQAFKNFRQRGSEVTIEEIPEEPQLPETEGPLGQLLGRELSEEVRRAIESLPPLQREALILFEYEQLPLAEVAAIVGADTGTIKARLSRARARLRRALAPYLKSNPQAVTVER